MESRVTLSIPKLRVEINQFYLLCILHMSERHNGSLKPCRHIHGTVRSYHQILQKKKNGKKLVINVFKNSYKIGLK